MNISTTARRPVDIGALAPLDADLMQSLMADITWRYQPALMPDGSVPIVVVKDAPRPLAVIQTCSSSGTEPQDMSSRSQNTIRDLVGRFGPGAGALMIVLGVFFGALMAPVLGNQPASQAQAVTNTYLGNIRDGNGDRTLYFTYVYQGVLHFSALNPGDHFYGDIRSFNYPAGTCAMLSVNGGGPKPIGSVEQHPALGSRNYANPFVC